MDGDVDFLWEALSVLVEGIMDAEGSARTGAGYGERSPARVTQRNGYRSRAWDTRVGTMELHIPKLREGSYFSSLLEPQRRGERALLAVIQQAYVEGVSTRRVDDLVKALGCKGISKSQVSRICQELDVVVDGFLCRPLDGGPYPYLWVDALTQKVSPTHDANRQRPSVPQRHAQRPRQRHTPPHPGEGLRPLHRCPVCPGLCGAQSSTGRCAGWRRDEGRDRYERLSGVVGLVALVDRGTGIYDGDVLTASTLGEHHRHRYPGFQALHRFCGEVVQLYSETSRIPTSNVPDVGGYFADVERQVRAAGGYATVSIHDTGIRFQPSLDRYDQVGQRRRRRSTV